MFQVLGALRAPKKGPGARVGMSKNVQKCFIYAIQNKLFHRKGPFARPDLSKNIKQCVIYGKKINFFTGGGL